MAKCLKICWYCIGLCGICLRSEFSNSATRLFADLCKIMQEKGAQTLGISGPVSTPYVSLFFLVTGCRSLNQFREFHPFSPLVLGVILFL